MTDEDILEQARQDFDRASEVENENRIAWLDDTRFARLEEQWPLAIRTQREQEGRPCLTINKLAPVIRQVVNDSRQNKPSIKVQPQDSAADPKTAEIYSGLIRNIETSSDADVAYDTAVENAVTGGWGYFRVNTKYACDDTFDQDLVIERMANPLAVFGDPDSTAADSSDWNKAFVVEAMQKKDFEAKYKGAEAVDWDAAGYTGLQAPWLNGEEIMVAEYWVRTEEPRKITALSDGQVIAVDDYEFNREAFEAEGVVPVGKPREVRSHKVTQYILTGAEVLETVEWAGKYIPIIPVYGDEVVVEGKRYLRSLIRSAKDSQRMYNYWSTSATELVALAPKAPFIGPVGSFETDRQKWETANNASHAYIEYDAKAGMTAPQRQAFAGVPGGVLQEAMNASENIKATTGIYDASLGAKSNETSGKAIMARQREGDVSTFHFIDNLSRAIRHGGRILIDLIPKVYNTERMIRVLGPEGEAEVVKIGSTGAPDPSQQQAQAEDPGYNHVYDLAAGKYDLTVSSGPSFTSRREEAVVQMTEMIRGNPALAPIIGDIIAKNLDWPGADEIEKRLKKMLPPQLQEGEGGQPQIPPQVQQMIQQGQQVIQQLGQENEQLKAQAQKAELDTQIKSAELAIKQEELEIKRFEAETDRLRAEIELRQPPKLPAATPFTEAA